LKTNDGKKYSRKHILVKEVKEEDEEIIIPHHGITISQPLVEARHPDSGSTRQDTQQDLTHLR
jgi:hypothetical protein